MKKMLAMLLAMAMLLVVFAGCGKNDSTNPTLPCLRSAAAAR